MCPSYSERTTFEEEVKMRMVMMGMKMKMVMMGMKMRMVMCVWTPDECSARCKVTNMLNGSKSVCVSSD